MKKLLTVLLVIAVICTFSFGSAFAYTSWTGEKTTNYLLDDEDFMHSTGAYGITEVYRAQLVEDYEYLLAGYTVDDYENMEIASGNYYAPEKDVAKTKIEAALEAVKAAKTAKEAYTVDSKLKADLKDLGCEAINKKYDKNNNAFQAAIADAADISDDYSLLIAGVNLVDFTTGETTITTEKGFFLEGFGYATVTSGNDLSLNYKQVRNWLFDNGYNTVAEAKAGLAKLVAGLESTPVDTTFIANVSKELKGVASEFKAMLPVSGEGLAVFNTVAVEDIAKVDELIGKAIAVRDKYGDVYTAVPSCVVALWNSNVENKYGYNVTDKKFRTVVENAAQAYAGQDYAAVKALPDYKKMTEADKATVIELYNKLLSYVGVYQNVEAYLHMDTYDGHDDGLVATVNGNPSYENLAAAYEQFKGDDQTAFIKLDPFTVHSQEAARANEYTNVPAYFDSTEKNVKALEAARAAYDEFVKNYGYGELATHPADIHFTDEVIEARILAAEFNKAQDTAYDEKADKIDTSKLNAYLNNATVKVTSTKLAAKKVRVQAKVDAKTLEQIIGQLGVGCTVEYKFYHKAPGKSFKLTKTKAVNYITYTSKSLKAGKNSFRVGLVVKDSKGNVLASKSYKASSLAYRTIK